jgi:hypothetical protein
VTSPSHQPTSSSRIPINCILRHLRSPMPKRRINSS